MEGQRFPAPTKAFSRGPHASADPGVSWLARRHSLALTSRRAFSLVTAYLLDCMVRLTLSVDHQNWRLLNQVPRIVGAAAEAVIDTRGEAERLKRVFERSSVPMVMVDD